MLKNKNQFFVTGIDTEVGKTVVSAILVEALGADYWKPIQCGDLDHTDANKVRDLISHPTTTFFPESYLLQAPMSPHAAAAKEGIQLSLSDFVPPTTQNPLIIEGAGGLMVPFNEKECMIDLMEKLSFPVILVSKIYLGSINHTLLSIEALKRREIEIKGIIFVGEEHPTTEEVIAQHGQIPILGRIDWLAELNPISIKKAAQNIQL
ncbi:MAG: dethiobiotin synthase [Saprospiraceae bacterium]